MRRERMWFGHRLYLVLTALYTADGKFVGENFYNRW